ncbi:GtrA family protein [Paenibacillus sp. NAIST15-1]|uniref:GtrA family protein n=1 Tax=Paenibacillus sp. NAIST15-1 TaxID=1605994 RepID=UPI00086F631B|nr:GtrA family protein [Paenibacillus sp. NAIST15-1]GAV12374.1 GtrA family protein [Paenibacillus sp. NAIST15-1]
MRAGNGRPTLLTKYLNKEFIKFIFSGGVNTVATYLFYLLLLMFLNYSLSYTISYISGIFLSYYLNSIFVFDEKVSFRKFIKYPIVYLTQYILGIVLMYGLVEYLHLSVQIVPLVVIIVSLPITYLLSKLIIKSK